MLRPAVSPNMSNKVKLTVAVKLFKNETHVKQSDINRVKIFKGAAAQLITKM